MLTRLVQAEGGGGLFSDGGHDASTDYGISDYEDSDGFESQASSRGQAGFNRDCSEELAKNASNKTDGNRSESGLIASECLHDETCNTGMSFIGPGKTGRTKDASDFGCFDPFKGLISSSPSSSSSSSKAPAPGPYNGIQAHFNPADPRHFFVDSLISLVFLSFF